MQTGTGHIMRCRALADALQRGGAHTRFVCRHIPDTVRNLLEMQGHEVVQLTGAKTPSAEVDDLEHSAWLGVSQAQDAGETLHALADRSWDWMVVDHYALDARWENNVRRSLPRVMIIDDLADRQHAGEVLLDQNLVADLQHRYAARVPRNCRLLLGPRYALLNESYADLHTRVTPRNGVHRIVIFFGGSDRYNLTGRALDAVISLGRSDIEIDVVLSLNGSNSHQIEAIAARHPGVRCHRSLPSLAGVFAAADLSIGSFGATSWERLCLGVPTLAVLMARNQEEVASELHRAGLALSIGDAESATMETIALHVGRALSDPQFTAWSTRCMNVCDGRGVQRVVAALLECSAGFSVAPAFPLTAE